MREMSVAEPRYKAVLAVLADGRTITEVAASWGVSRQTLHAWLARYEGGGLEALADRSHRPGRCPHPINPEVEVAVWELQRAHPGWGPIRIRFELDRRGVAVSRSAAYRALRRAGLIDPGARRRRDEHWRRWGTWPGDGAVADGRRGRRRAGRPVSTKCLTGIDDHSRFCVAATLMPAERTRFVCDALTAALDRHGVREQIRTDNGKVFTGRFTHPPTEVLFDAICRRHGIEHLVTAPRSPTTTGKIERFHRTLPAEFGTGLLFDTLAQAEGELDEWVEHDNRDRPHQSLDMGTPAARFTRATGWRPAHEPDRSGPNWVARKVSTVDGVCVSWQVSVGVHRAGERCDVLVDDHTLQFWIGNQLLRTVTRTSTGPVRNKQPLGGALTKTRRH
ncbi:IS481 family transposase [Cellulomonas sp. H30R-01]|uniref:IS481 family transposase n=1 Tax=Cellulomonas sp. H30R-01 TaxID=2704467 RepID=UPI001EE3BBBD|nr:IS481 family transposase [Cellulomonas sp. H30R-01]